MRLGENLPCIPAVPKPVEDADPDKPTDDAAGDRENQETESLVARLMRSHRRCIFCGAELQDGSSCGFCGAAT
jgi:hypothetical protein